MLIQSRLLYLLGKVIVWRIRLLNNVAKIYITNISCFRISSVLNRLYKTRNIIFYYRSQSEAGIVISLKQILNRRDPVFFDAFVESKRIQNFKIFLYLVFIAAFFLVVVRMASIRWGLAAQMSKKLFTRLYYGLCGNSPDYSQKLRHPKTVSVLYHIFTWG